MMTSSINKSSQQKHNSETVLPRSHKANASKTARLATELNRFATTSTASSSNIRPSKGVDFSQMPSFKRKQPDTRTEAAREALVPAREQQPSLKDASPLAIAETPTTCSGRPVQTSRETRPAAVSTFFSSDNRPSRSIDFSLMSSFKRKQPDTNTEADKAAQALSKSQQSSLKDAKHLALAETPTNRTRLAAKLQRLTASTTYSTSAPNPSSKKAKLADMAEISFRKESSRETDEKAKQTDGSPKTSMKTQRTAEGALSSRAQQPPLKRHKVIKERGESSSGVSPNEESIQDKKNLSEQGESSLQNACKKEMNKRLGAKGKELRNMSGKEKAFLESFAAGLNILGKARLLKDKVHPEDTFTEDDLKDLLRDFHQESSSRSGKEKESYAPEDAGRILAKIFEIHLIIYEVGAFDEEKAIAGSGEFWDQEIEYGNPGQPQIMVGLYDGCFAPIARKASRRELINRAVSTAQITPQTSEKLYSKSPWEKEHTDALIKEISRQYEENPNSPINWVLAKEAVNQAGSGKKFFTRRQCITKYEAMRMYYDKRELKKDWRKEDIQALISAVNKQKSSEHICWQLVVQEIREATGAIFTPQNAWDKYIYVNPELKHGSWSRKERLLLFFGINHGMSNSEISKTLFKGKRSFRQCYDKWNSIKAALAGAHYWSTDDDKKLLEGYEKFKNHPKKWLRISKTYFNGTKHCPSNCRIRWKYLHKLTMEGFIGHVKETKQISNDSRTDQTSYTWTVKQDELLILAVVANDYDWEYISNDFFEGVCSKEEIEQRYKELESSSRFKKIEAKAIKLKEEFHSLFEGSSESETEEEGD